LKMEKLIKELQEKIDYYLNLYMPKEDEFPPELHKAMRYCLFSGGKRLRPALLLLSYEVCDGGKFEDVMPFACAVELIHTYSLIHDDLPAMDNDDYRRGKLTTHKVFGEAIAILSGDALFSYSFNLITKTNKKPEIILKGIEILTDAIGNYGIIGGQTMDILMKGKTPSPKILRYIHSHKTAFFISSCCEIGGILAEGKSKDIENLKKGGFYLGMAFQIADDLLDVYGDEEKVGKKLKKDIEKITYPNVYGVKLSQKMLSKYTELAKGFFGNIGKRGEILVHLADSLEKRVY